MRLLFLKIWVLVLTFGFGISVSALWRIYTLPALPIPVVDLTEPSAVVIGLPEESGLRIVDGLHNCGGSPAPETYKLSDGGQISVFCKPFKTRAAARWALEKKLRNAVIVDRTVFMDSYGKDGAEEVVITVPKIARLWRKDRVLCITEASSLEHLKWFQSLKAQ